MKIQNSNYRTYSRCTNRQPLNNTPKNDTQKVCGERPYCKSEISNIYYKPVFTSNSEMTDSEFEERRKKLKKYLQASYKKAGYPYYKGLTDRSLSGLNKDNIRLAGKYVQFKEADFKLSNELADFKFINKDNLSFAEALLLLDRNNKYGERLDSLNLECLKHVTPDITDFAVKIIKDDGMPRNFRTELITALDSDNLEFADYLLDTKIGYFKIPEILSIHSKDKIAAFSMLCDYNRDDHLRYPVDVIKAFPQMLDEKDEKFLKNLYKWSKDNYLSDDIFSYINSGNIKIAKELLSYKDNPSFFSSNKISPKISYPVLKNVLAIATPENEKLVRKLVKYLRQNACNIDEAACKEFVKGFNSISPDMVDDVYKILENDAISKEFLKNLKAIPAQKYTYLFDNDFLKLQERVERLKTKVLAHPDLYVNDDGEEPMSKEAMIKTVHKFFDKNWIVLMLASSVLDKEGMDNLMRRRFDTASDYLSILLCNFENPEYEVLKQLNNSCNIDGKPFMPHQKVEFIDLITYYHDHNLSYDEIFKMLETGRIDFYALQTDLLRKIIIEVCDMDEEAGSAIPMKNLLQWNREYISLINPQNYESDDKYKFRTMLELALKNEDFKTLIQTDSEYGELNRKVKQEFQNAGINYEKWLSPSKDLNVHFVSKKSDTEKLDEISAQVKECLDNLLKTPARGFVEKQLGKYIRNDKFVIPQQYTTDISQLYKYTENVLKRLNPVWNRAEINLNDPNKSNIAVQTLAIRDNLQLQQSIMKNNSNEFKSKKAYDLTIKMWDRIPQKDLFQGNYSTCCIGVGGGNEPAMFDYLLNTTFNMIEIVDNKTGKTIGNALCYFVKNEQNEPEFVIDNIEINNNFKIWDKDFKYGIRNAIFEYAKNLADSITNKPDTKIFLGTNNNDIPEDDLDTIEETYTLLGEINSETIYENAVYLDAFDGWCDIDSVQQYSDYLWIVR